MDNLPTWAVEVAAVAVGLSPGLAILSARSIARLLHLALRSWPKVPANPRLRPDAAGVVALRG
jgi:hypothetical protein